MPYPTPQYKDIFCNNSNNIMPFFMAFFPLGAPAQDSAAPILSAHQEDVTIMHASVFVL